LVSYCWRSGVSPHSGREGTFDVGATVSTVYVEWATVPSEATYHGTWDSSGCTSKKVYVCKYVGTPYVDERLQTGQNPIDVSVNAIGESPVVVGSYFKDAQGRSYVLAFDTGQTPPRQLTAHSQARPPSTLSRRPAPRAWESAAAR
ncbi:MAG: hypothetical protein ACP5VP_11645, partial [Candidatus Limnocylindrales bacterium]